MTAPGLMRVPIKMNGILKSIGSRPKADFYGAQEQSLRLNSPPYAAFRVSPIDCEVCRQGCVLNIFHVS